MIDAERSLVAALAHLRDVRLALAAALVERDRAVCVWQAATGVATCNAAPAARDLLTAARWSAADVGLAGVSTATMRRALEHPRAPLAAAHH